MNTKQPSGFDKANVFTAGAGVLREGPQEAFEGGRLQRGHELVPRLLCRGRRACRACCCGRCNEDIR